MRNSGRLNETCCEPLPELSEKVGDCRQVSFWWEKKTLVCGFDLTSLDITLSSIRGNYRKINKRIIFGDTKTEQTRIECFILQRERTSIAP